MKPHALKAHAVIIGVALLSLSGCNIFDPFDSPTSDAQLISAARACFNEGKIDCARENYEKLSGDYADIKNSEEAFLSLEEVNAGMGSFVAAFGQGSINTGKALTSMANSIGSNASRANRVKIFQAYQRAALVVDTRLRGLSRFVTSIALAAEMLAENAASPGHFVAGDLVVDVAACSALGAGCAAGLAGSACDFQSASKPLKATGSGVGGADLEGVDLAADVDTVTASLETFNAAINTINNALSEMGVTSTSADVGGFSTAIASLTIQVAGANADSPCYRQGLLSQGIGQ